MSFLFGHKYNLTISRPPQINTAATTTTPTQQNNIIEDVNDFRTRSTDAVVIDDLQITATVTNSKDSTKATTVIKVWGVDSNTLSYVSSGSVVLLEAGWESLEAQTIIFAGQVVTSEVDTSGDLITVELTCQDGYTPNTSVKVSLEFPEQSTALDVLQSLEAVYAANGVPSGRSLSTLESLLGQGMSLPVDQIIYPNGNQITGYLDTALSKFCKSVGFVYYITNSRLYIEPANYTETTNSFELLPTSVLSARKSSKKSTTTSQKDTSENKEGYIVKTFLDGRIELGNFITIQLGETMNGSFKVTKVSHNLDYEGDSWYTTLEVESV